MNYRIDEESLCRSANRMEESARKNTAAADRIETAVHRLALMLEDGYGGNGLRLIEALEQANPGTSTGT